MFLSSDVVPSLDLTVGSTFPYTLQNPHAAITGEDGRWDIVTVLVGSNVDEVHLSSLKKHGASWVLQRGLGSNAEGQKRAYILKGGRGVVMVENMKLLGLLTFLLRHTPP